MRAAHQIYFRMPHIKSKDRVQPEASPTVNMDKLELAMKSLVTSSESDEWSDESPLESSQESYASEDGMIDMETWSKDSVSAAEEMKDFIVDDSQDVHALGGGGGFSDEGDDSPQSLAIDFGAHQTHGAYYNQQGLRRSKRIATGVVAPEVYKDERFDELMYGDVDEHEYNTTAYSDHVKFYKENNEPSFDYHSEEESDDSDNSNNSSDSDGQDDEEDSLESMDDMLTEGTHGYVAAHLKALSGPFDTN